MSAGADQPDERNNPAGPPSSEAGDSFAAIGPFFQRIDWLCFGVTTFVATVVYLRTLAPEVTLEFSGILSASAMYAGVAHPPGFPVWTLYSWLFVKLLPFSNIAWRVAVGSAVAAALACGLVASMVSRVGRVLLNNTPAFASRKLEEQNLLRLICGFVAGMALGLSQVVWRVAVVAEIWALSVLLFTATLCLLLRWMAGPERKRFLYGAFFVFGLLLTSNQELVLMTPALLFWVLLGDRGLGRDLSLAIAPVAAADWGLSTLGQSSLFGSYMRGNTGLLVAFLLVGVAAVVAIVRTRRFGSEWRSATLCGVALLLGLGCYFYLPIASMANPPMNWGYPRTAEGFFHAITRGQYERYYPTGQLGQFMEQLWILAKDTWKGFGWPYCLFIALPFSLLRRTGRSGRDWLLGSAAIFVCVGPLMLALLNPSTDLASVQFRSPFFCGMDVVLALWAGLGLMVFGSIVAKPRLQPPLDITPAPG